MQTRVERALELRAQNYNCAQVVIAALAEALGVSEEAAFGFAAGFGGGLRLGEVCGAASGAVMALGLRYGQIRPFDTAAKARCGEQTARFMGEFQARMGGLRCRELLGGDQHDPALAGVMAERKQAVCPLAIRTALEILAEMGL